MSRFDLIFLILDPKCKDYDERLARHLIAMYHNQEEKNETMDEEDDMSIGFGFQKKNLKKKF